MMSISFSYAIGWVRIKRWMAVAAFSAAGAVIAWFAGQHGFYRNYENFVFLVGYWLTPWIAIAGIDLSVNWRAGAARCPSGPFFDRRRILRAGTPV
jgi:nucleobase:cation symporter-1, NCS1 family